MKINIEMDELRKRKLMICTPCYGGQMYSTYHTSMMELQGECMAKGIHMQSSIIENESLVQRARNNLVKIFLDSDCTHLMFIDADIQFQAIDVIHMLAICDGRSYRVVTAPYGKKSIHWDIIADAARMGVPYTELHKLASKAVFNLFPGEPAPESYSEPIKVVETGTGMMMIHRKVFEDLMVLNSDMYYYSDYRIGDDKDQNKKIFTFFHCEVADNEARKDGNRRYLSEDYFFCKLARKAGIHIWMCPWISCGHKGTYLFESDTASLISFKEFIIKELNMQDENRIKEDADKGDIK